MTRLLAAVVLMTGAFLTTSVFGDPDFHFGGEDSLMPGVRPYRGRHARTPPPLHDSPILFPDDPIPGRRPQVAPPVEPATTGLARTGPDGTLDLPLDFDEIDFGILNRINSIANISDFANLFDLDLPESGPAFDLGFDVGLRTGISAQDGETYQMANCKPELVTVPLDLPAESSTLFFPTCIRLEQCGGCCYGPLLTCRPTVTKVVKVKVLKVSTASNTNTNRVRGGGRTRRRRQNKQTYHIVDAVKHTACECGCKIREEDCHSDLHTYYEGDCACRCKNKDEQAKCAQQNTTKYWDNDTCNCYCRKSLDCGTGEFFSQDTCSCERLTARSGFVSFDTEARPRRRRKPVRVPLA